MKAARTILTTLLATVAVTGWGQGNPPGEQAGGAQPQPGGGMALRMQPGLPPGGGGRGADPAGDNFFPPELVMQNQSALALSEEQKVAIKAAMRKGMESFTDLQWRQSEKKEAMDALLKEPRVDEGKVMAELDELLKVENDVKRLQLGLMVKVKNVLTPEQQEKLRQIKRSKSPSQGMGQPSFGLRGPAAHGPGPAGIARPAGAAGPDQAEPGVPPLQPPVPPAEP